MKALALHATGVVQGVGFRPFVYNLARSMGLEGWVLNATDGVHILVQGDEAAVDSFPARLRSEAPPMSYIDSLLAEEVDPEPLDGFEIRESAQTTGATTLVSPDIATCEACRAELADPDDRRYGFPFINCTNCGPRFTVIESVPYDRPSTTMRDFPMCDACAAEYADPADRRFHAQPDACFVCGPRLYLNAAVDASAPLTEQLLGCPGDWVWSPAVEVVPRPHRDAAAELARSTAIIEAAARLLQAGGILAVKGLGGFQLACDATNPSAVARLRERKNRYGKPLAVMVADLDAARALGVRIDDDEAALLAGTARPIVLLRRTTSATPLARGVADGLAEIGVMLPYTPLHTLIVEAAGTPLVMTSGNRSEEPIATGNAEALERLGDIADAFLMHDRGIASRYDDSVTRVVGGVTAFVRRARGFAPHPLPLSFEADTPILAVGPEQKNTVTLVSGRHAFVSQHIGDLENAETLDAFEETIARYEELFDIEPHVVAHDLHPEYLSTKWALASGLPAVGVQHHHAHIVSVTAEHGIEDDVVGVAFDGTGYGEDGTIWGGEVLVGGWASYERVAHLRQVPMPGGAAAIRRPARMALGTLAALGLLDEPGAAALRSRLATGEEETLLRMVERGVNSPVTSSMGRLFDAVASIAGVADDARYEGEAAILLEAAIDHAADGTYAFTLVQNETAGQPLIIDSAPVVASVLSDVAAGTPVGTIAARFHRSVVDCIVTVSREAASRAGTRRVALAGGVFMNRFVAEHAVNALAAAELTPLVHLRLPVNDGAVSFGQAVVAWARRHEV